MPRDRFGNLHRRLALLKDENDAYAVGGRCSDMVALELMAGFYQTVRGPRNLTELSSAVPARRQRWCCAGLADRGGFVGRRGSLRAAAADSIGSRLGTTLGGMPDETFRAACGKASQWKPVRSPPIRRDRLVAMLLGRGHRIAARLFARV